MRKIIAGLTILSGLMSIILLFVYLSMIFNTDESISRARVEAENRNIEITGEPAGMDEKTNTPENNVPDQKTQITSGGEPFKEINYTSFHAKVSEKETVEFEKLSSYIAEARKNSYDIYYKNNAVPIINNNFTPPDSYSIGNVPLILQHPELPRGCEVTSLAMLMSFCGLETDKLILAEKIKRDTTPRVIKNKKIYWGNPNNGFIGDMYDIRSPGYGVYHTPIFELLKEYAPERAVDITGCEFEDLLWLINKGMPVWMIVNTTFDALPDSAFQTWHTPDGAIRITYREHAVLLTGYNKDFVYFNDPLFSYTEAAKPAFIECWRQMGSQAVTLNP